MPLTPHRGRARTAARTAARSRTRTVPRTLARTVSLAGACVLAALAALVALAGPATAHAELVSSTPQDRSVIDTEPHQVTLDFSEAITLRLSSVTVIGPTGHRVDNGPLHTVGSGSTHIAVPLAPDPGGRGTYVLTWRVTTSDDGHTTSGALTFSVGAPTVPASSAAGGGLPGGGSSDPVTDAVLDTAVWLGLAGLALLIGFAAVRLYCLPAGLAGADTDGAAFPDDDTDDPAGPEPSVARTDEDAGHGSHPVAAVRWPAALGWTVLLVGTVLQLFVYGPATQGSSVTHAFDRSLLSASLSTHVGHTLVARIMLLAVVAVAGEAILRHRRAGTVAAAALALLLALTWSEISHAPSGSMAPLAVLVTTLHVTSMAVWAGGMATLAVLLTRGADADLDTAAARFSRLALYAVCLLAATGLYQAYREVGSISALTGTHYGKLLLTKTGEFVLVLAIAAFTRTRLHRRRADTTSWTLRRSVLLELAGVTGVLIVTVMLISTAPAHGTHGAGSPTAVPPVTVLPYGPAAKKW